MYEYEPRIWDPQNAAETIHPTFSSPPGSLPEWLKWEDGKLVGIPTQLQDGIEVVVLATVSTFPGYKLM